MPLPLFIAIGAGVAATVGAAAGIHGAVKMKEANDTVKLADRCHKRNIKKFEEQSGVTTKSMDDLGKLELEILHSFKKFSDTLEKIQNRPQFDKILTENVDLPKYSPEELDKVSVGAGVLLGGLSGAAIGTAGGFAAAGATTSAVMALGTASTGTAIASLSGVAATNATLAALGGGAIAAGGGGMALGSMVLGGATLGVGILVGGVIFSVTGSKISDKADEAWRQMRKAEEIIKNICTYLAELNDTACQYANTLLQAQKKYEQNFDVMFSVVNDLGIQDWNQFSPEAKRATKNAVLLVGLLFKMCKVKLVKKAEQKDAMNEINEVEITESLQEAEQVFENVN